MGLSSSQGRLLMLTSALSNVQFQEIMVSQRQNLLASESEKAASEYNEKTNNYKLTMKIPDASSATGYTSSDFNYANLSALGYLVTNDKGDIYLKKDENGEWIIPKDSYGNELLTVNQETGRAVIDDKEYDIADGSQYLTKKGTLQNLVMNGYLNVVSLNDLKKGLTSDILESETQVEWVLDTSDDAEALSKYEMETARISRKDNQLDMEMQQLETQHNALIKEYDSVREVIGNNIERTFKLFSNS